MRPQRTDLDFRLDPFAPLIAALCTGYYGFLAGLDTADASGTVALWIAFVWVLRAACAFSLVALLACFTASPLARVASVASAVVLAVGCGGILVWDLLDDAHSVAAHPFLLGILAIWNGWVAWTTARSTVRPAT
jgi:hypothetical protein